MYSKERLIDRQYRRQCELNQSMLRESHYTYASEFVDRLIEVDSEFAGLVIGASEIVYEPTDPVEREERLSEHFFDEWMTWLRWRRALDQHHQDLAAFLKAVHWDEDDGDAPVFVDVNPADFETFLVEVLDKDLDEAWEESVSKEVLQWHLVDGWLAERLEEQHQVVIRYCGLYIWGRGTSGAALEDDGVITAIQNATHAKGFNQWNGPLYRSALVWFDGDKVCILRDPAAAGWGEYQATPASRTRLMHLLDERRLDAHTKAFHRRISPQGEAFYRSVFPEWHDGLTEE